MRRIDFIPEGFVLARARRRMTVRFAIGFGAVVVLGASWLKYVSVRHLDRLEARLAELDREHQSILSKETAHRAQSDETVLRLKLQPSVPALSVINQLAQLMPPSMGLTGVSLSAQTVEPEPIGADDRKSRKKRGKSGQEGTTPMTLSLEGVAPDDVTVAKFIGNLDQRSLFENVELGYSRPAESGELRAREFQILAEIPLNRPILLSRGETTP